jgi:hypothetical protein
VSGSRVRTNAGRAAGRCAAGGKATSAMDSERYFRLGFLNNAQWAESWLSGAVGPMFCRWCYGVMIYAEDRAHFYCTHCDELPAGLQTLLVEEFDLPEWPGFCQEPGCPVEHYGAGLDDDGAPDGKL